MNDNGECCQVHIQTGFSAWGLMVVVVTDRGNRLLERTHAKLYDKASLRRGECSGQYMRTLYCFACEFMFLVMQKSQYMRTLLNICTALPVISLFW